LLVYKSFQYWSNQMKIRPLIAALAISISASFAAAQTAETPQLAAAHKLQADLDKALPSSSLSDDEKTQLKADATQLVTNATMRAQGGTPDRKAGRAAGMEIGKQSSKLQPADAEVIKADLKALQAAAM
jgi:hypothetical protein